MLKSRASERGPTGKRFPQKDPFEGKDMIRLNIILATGFSVARGYGSLSRDRHYFEMFNGTTVKELHDFCSRHLNGSPIPGADPVQDGPKLLRMFRAAEGAGLGKVIFVKAQRFVPEMKL